MKKVTVTIYVLLNIIFNQARSQPVITLTNFSSGYSYPMGIFNCGDSRLFIVERQGYIYISNPNGVKKPTPFLNIYDRVNHTGTSERGLLSMAFHPSYSGNGYFYVSYVDTLSNKVVSRFNVSSSNTDVAVASSELKLMTVSWPYTTHRGGCMAFGKDGYLYISMGDGDLAGNPGNTAQDDTKMLGKMLRINVNATSGTLPYSIPPTNPYFGNTNVVQEIWAKVYAIPGSGASTA